MPNINKDPRFWLYNTKFGRIVLFALIIFVIISVIVDQLT